MGPGDAVGQVLDDQRHRSDQTGNEAAARQVVAAQEEEDRGQQGERQQQAGDNRQDDRMAVGIPGPASGVPFRPR